jgi:sialate O-acetylesterase
MRYWVLIVILFPASSTAQFEMGKIFSDNMVLQRDRPIAIWGKGIPGFKVEAAFAGETTNSIVKTDSTWKINFKPQTINRGPQTLIVTCGKQKIELSNILTGDIWLCLGQSNMEWPMHREMHFKEELLQSEQPMLRFYNPMYAGKDVYGSSFTDSIIQRLNTDDFYSGQWQSSDSVAFKNMSAVGYYFGTEIISEMNVPVGLINLAIGGAPIESFISREVMLNDPQFITKVTGEWLSNEALPVWVRERANQNVGNQENISKDGLGRNHAFKPGFAYEAGIEPLLSLPIKGIIWYQGESNAQEKERVEEYGKLFELMVNDYRTKWGQPSLPFYWVQLSSIDTIQYKAQFWPEFRDEQRKLLGSIHHGGMAVSSDVGAKNDVHPRNKKAVGQRLARLALNKVYKKNILPSGPLPLHANYLNGKIVISFEHAGQRLQTADDKPVRGFSINRNTEMEVIIQNNTIVIPVKEKPAFIYYAWKPFTDANLVNSEGLPASTFKIKVQ